MLYSYGSELLTIVVLDLWGGGEYTVLYTLRFMMIFVLVLMVYAAKEIGGKIAMKILAQ